MTRHTYAQTGLVTPSPLDRLIDAMLRVFAMLMSSVRSTLQMPRRHPPVNATQAMPAGLPRETSDTSNKEHHAVPNDSPLTTLSHTSPSSLEAYQRYASPAKAGVQSQTQSARSAQNLFAPSLDPGLRRGCVLNQHATNKNAAA